LVGLSHPHPEAFVDIPWSTPRVYRTTLQRVAAINVPVVNVPGWYDIDDDETLQLLKAELAGERLPFAEPGLQGADAPATRHFFARRLMPLELEASW
jgi:hypothetical protein